MPTETPDVAVSIRLSLTLRTPVTTEPATPNSPDRNPPELLSGAGFKGTEMIIGGLRGVSGDGARGVVGYGVSENRRCCRAGC